MWRETACMDTNFIMCAILLADTNGVCCASCQIPPALAPASVPENPHTSHVKILAEDTTNFQHQ